MSSRLLILNQMAGPLTWELALDARERYGTVAMLTGHPDTLAKQTPQGLTIDAAPVYERGSYPKRIKSWLAYLRVAKSWVKSFPTGTPALWFSNPPISIWTAAKLAKGGRYPFAFMVHDIYPDLLYGLGKLSRTHPIVRLWDYRNKRAYEHAELVLTLGDYMAERLMRQFDVSKTSAGNIPVVPPWADTKSLSPLPKSENAFAKEVGVVDKICVAYSGNMGVGHDIETMHASAQSFDKSDPFHFLWIGAGPKWEWLSQQLKQNPLDNATLLGWQPEERLPETLATADISMVSLEEGIEGVAIPSKAFTALSVGAAILLLSRKNSELAKIIERFDCGWVIEPGDLAGFRKVLTFVRDHPEVLKQKQARAREAALTIGSRKNSQLILDALDDVFPHLKEQSVSS